MADNAKTQELLKAGVAAARNGDKEKARDLLQQVVELDEYSEQGWFWLASVVETDEERRTCLGNVVLINPNNTKAQALLDQIEQRAASGVKGLDAISGTNAGRKRIFIAIGAALLLVIAAVIVLNLGGNDDSSGDPTADNQALLATNQTSATISPAPEQLSLTPAPTLDFVPPTLPPVATATPTLEQSSVLQPTIPPLSIPLEGQILLSSGNAFGNAEFQPIHLVDLSNPSVFTPATENELRGNKASVAPSGLRYIFAQFNTGQQAITLQVANMNGTNSRILSAYWGFDPAISEQLMPAWSPISDEVVFVGRGLSQRTKDIFLVNVPETLPDTFDPSPLRQLTTDSVDESWPAWSPNGTHLVYVADTSQLGFTGIDLRVISTTSGAIQYLTRDGLDLIETAPDWGGPDNNWVIYSASTSRSSETNIWIVSLNALSNEAPIGIPIPTETPLGDGESAQATAEFIPTATATPEPTIASAESTITDPFAPRLLIDLGPHDIQPRWSPDGRYIIFSSDYLGNYDVYIYEFETGNIYALTNSPRTVDIASDWIR